MAGFAADLTDRLKNGFFRFLIAKINFLLLPELNYIRAREVWKIWIEHTPDRNRVFLP